MSWIYPIKMDSITRIFMLDICFFLWINLSGVGAQDQLCSVREYSAPLDVIKITEDTLPGTILKQLDIVGDDTEIALSPKQDPDGYLLFNDSSRSVKLLKEIKRTDTSDDVKRLNVDCRLKQLNTEVDITVNVVVADVNDHAPYFDQAYTAEISEDAAINSTIISGIQAKDGDPDNEYIRYEIKDGIYANYFEIPLPAKGTVTLKKKLDFELLPELQFTIIARDQHPKVNDMAQPVLSGETNVTVKVLDADDQNPRFENTYRYEGRIQENAVEGSTVQITPPIVAKDPDTLNTQVYYELMDTEDSKYFKIDPNTAEVTLIQAAITRNTQFFLLVRATQVDNKNRYDTAALIVYVQAANVNQPKFLEKHVVVDLVENTPIGSDIVTLAAIDSDEGTSLQYSMVSQVPEFSLDSKTAVISLAKTLDAETTNQYNLTVQVSDGENTDTALVTINVIDINDNNPVFGQTNYEFQAARVKGSVVGEVKVTDRDSNSALTFSLAPDDHSQYFSIDNEGTITVAVSAEYLTLASYKVIAVVKDNDTPPRKDSVPVNIIFDEIKGSELPPVVPSSPRSETVVEKANDMNFIIIIVLGVLSAVLLIIIIILVIYVCRNKQRKSHRNDNILRAHNYDNNLNIPKHKTADESYYSSPEGLAYKPNQLQHHLEYYQNVEMDDEGAAPQDNPFMADDTRSEHTYHYNGFNESQSQGTASLYSSSQDLKRQMYEVNEIDYDTAVAPVGHEGDYVPRHMQMNGSVPSSLPSSSEQSLTSGSGQEQDSFPNFKAGSTQKLMTSKGSMNKRPGVSFIEGHQNAIDPNAGPGDDDRPGITVYY